MKSLPFIGESKIRLSWGRSGKGIENEDYASYSYYVTSGQYIDLPVITPIQLELDNLKWQTVTSWNAGVDLNLFKMKLYITFDVYDKITTDLSMEGL